MGKQRNKIILVGFMGTGKSTIAKILSERLGLARMDLDEAIEEEAGCSIPELFENEGEARFRDLEADVLCKLLSAEQPAVIATGGGAVLRESNRQMMLESGLVAALKADLETIIARVSGDGSRPLLAGDLREKAARLLNERADAYQFAHLEVVTDNRTPAEAAELICEVWEREA